VCRDDGPLSLSLSLSLLLDRSKKNYSLLWVGNTWIIIIRVFSVKRIFRKGICVVGEEKTTELESVVKQNTVVVGGKHLDNNNNKRFFYADADVSNRNLCCGKKKLLNKKVL
jgi:hypothetical protein